MDLDWKRLLKLSRYEVLGLDIGSSAVKIVQLHKNNAGYTVKAAGIADISNDDGDDEKHKEVNTVRAIRDCFRSTGIQTQFAVCSVCGPEVAIRYFKFPPLPPEEIQGAVTFEAEQVCPFNVREGAVDYQLIPGDKNNISGVLVAATNKLIEGKRRLAENADLNTVLMDVDGLALLNCFGKYEKAPQFCKKLQNEAHKPGAGTTTAILNVGSSFTNLAIMAGAAGKNALPFIRDMAYAGDSIIEQIATENNISTETVSKILSGCEDPSNPQLELHDSLARACQKLITDVNETLRYYAAQEKSTAVEKVFVCGGFALVKGFVELLDSQLPAETVLWNPFDRIRCAPDLMCEDILRKNGPAMAVAAGLAMRSI